MNRSWVEKFSESIGLIPKISHRPDWSEELMMEGPKPLYKYPDPSEWDDFIEYYIKTFARQNLELGTQFNVDLQIIKRLVLGLYEKKLGRMFISYTQEGQAGSIAFFGIDHNRAYFLFGANNPDLRNEHTGTAVLWDSFKLLCSDGISEVDLEGINSPARGWFKLSFGGTLVPYFKLNWNRQ